MKPTLVLGASTNIERYSNLAVKMLLQYNHKVYAIGNKAGEIFDIKIETEKLPFKNIDTVTLYLNAARQKEFYNYIISLQPKRIIFNPGTENEELENLVQENNIATMQACTLVLLKSNQY